MCRKCAVVPRLLRKKRYANPRRILDKPHRKMGGRTVLDVFVLKRTDSAEKCETDRGKYSICRNKRLGTVNCPYWNQNIINFLPFILLALRSFIYVHCTCVCVG